MLSLSGEILLWNETVEKILIIFHWDSDGISSAASLYEELSKQNKLIDLYVHRIGEYSLDREEINLFKNKNYDLICIVDISFPTNTLSKLTGICDRLTLLDHHFFSGGLKNIEVINPESFGKNYPSTSWIIKDFFDRDADLLAVMGAIGDQEEEIKEFDAYNEIKKYLNSRGLTLKDVLRMVNLVDANYKINNRYGVVNAVFKLLEYKNFPLRILEDKEWTERANMVEEEINKWVEEPLNREGESIVFKEIDSRFNIISSVTRKISSNNPGKLTIVSNRGYFKDRIQVYFRVNNLDVDLTWIIKKSRSKGYVSGGRRNVVGLIIPRNDYKPFMKEILDRLGDLHER